MSKVFIDESTLTAIGDAIRSKEGSEGLIPTTEMKSRIEAISGGVNYLDYIQTCKFDSLNLFGKSKVELSFAKSTNLNGMFTPKFSSSAEYKENANITVEELILHAQNPITSIQQLFDLHVSGRDAALKQLTFDVDFSNLQAANMVFIGLNVLEIIDGTPINLSNLGADAVKFMQNCPKLREIRFSGILSRNFGFDATVVELSKDSIESIMNCLSADATDQTLTLPLTAVNTAFETSEGAADGSTSAEWLALVAAHSNWTISLV